MAEPASKPPIVVGPARRTSEAIPPKWAPIVRKRLGLFALLVSALTVCVTLVPSAFHGDLQRASAQGIVILVTELGLVIDAIVVYLVWGSRWSDRAIVRWSGAYPILRAFPLALGPLPSEGVPLLTWALLIVVAVPVILPSSRQSALFTAGFAALMQPLGLWLLGSRGTVLVTVTDAALSTVSAVFAVLLSLLVGGVLRAIRTEGASQVGSYDLVRRIGRGGMGEVWAAEHRFLSRPAAIKIIYGKNESRQQKERSELRFRREAQVTARLTSPHTIQVFDYGIAEDGAYYYVMEHLDGFDLQTLVSDFGPMPPGRALYLLRQMCDSLGEAHQAGLIHRDLKPSNLFVVRRGLRGDFVKVLDFGLVGLTDRLRSASYDGQITAAGMMTGTPAYMSPEMVLGAEVDGRADIYSLGCVLYFLVTGKLLYPGRPPLQMAMAHAHESLPPFDALVPELPSDLVRLLRAMLAKDPADRPRSASALLELLDELDRATMNWTQSEASLWWDEKRPAEKTRSMRIALRRERKRAQDG